MTPPQKRARQTLSDALKKLIVESVVSKGHSKADVARKYNLSFSTVFTIIKRFEHNGQILSLKRGGCATHGQGCQYHAGLHSQASCSKH